MSAVNYNETPCQRFLFKSNLTMVISVRLQILTSVRGKKGFKQQQNGNARFLQDANSVSVDILVC